MPEHEELSADFEDLWKVSDALGRIEDMSGFTIQVNDGTLGRVREKMQEGDIGYLIVDDDDHKTHVLPAGLITTVDGSGKSASIGRSLSDVQRLIATTGGGSSRSRERGDIPFMPFST